MRRPALYSSSRPGRPARAEAAPPADPTAAAAAAAAMTPEAGAPVAPPPPRWRVRLRRPTSLEWLWLLVLVLTTLLVWAFTLGPAVPQRRLTQQDIDAAVLKTLSSQPLPSEYAKAYEAIRPSVVRVVGYIRRDRLKPDHPAVKSGKLKPPQAVASAASAAAGDEVEFGVGTGVVIVDKGLILTNLHVVSGADRIEVTFADGLQASAYVRNVQPENDLAVLQANKLPDDLFAATLRSTADLQPGDKVMAVGFPFGIGPSASAGVVSGLQRVFRSPEGQHDMRNLIQFDAAANPGNSGGPLVTMDGEVVGIVTAILNPTPARTFIGIGFAVPIENAASAVGLPPF
ncbi:S1C family serine protease [Ramlibacter sp. MAHUQ-53]|uniref:S1C family serine protease n=1 Tax=unclassified Ramlibacter TaxID=2617605 RepID=UPI003632B292